MRMAQIGDSFTVVARDERSAAIIEITAALMQKQTRYALNMLKAFVREYELKDNRDFWADRTAELMEKRHTAKALLQEQLRQDRLDLIKIKQFTRELAKYEKAVALASAKVDHFDTLIARFTAPPEIEENILDI